tara:strand:+ start:1353 stop:1535 length:183 start_codon:yes stop_codon:yes gene_type:complete
MDTDTIPSSVKKRSYGDDWADKYKISNAISRKKQKTENQKNDGALHTKVWSLLQRLVFRI